MWRIGLMSLLLGGCSTPISGETPDASPPPLVDAAPDAPYTATPAGCDDLPDSLYVTPPQLPAARGALVRCVQGPVLDAAAVTAAAEDAGATIEATTGVSIVKLAYRTVRADGTPAVTTAVAWLPLVPRATPAPVALIARSTSGIADGCAPTRSELPLAELGLPLAARGFVSIAPDFAGLGNEGVHAYLDNREAASQLFDGALALRALVGTSIGAPQVALGYSQGGGIVLSAQALEHTLTGARTLRGVVAIAPEWPTRIASFGYERLLRDPDQLTGATGLAPPTVTALRQYGWFANRLGPAHAADSFPAAERAEIADHIESLCTVELGAALGAGQLRIRDLVDEPFRVAMLACIDGTAGCVEPARSFHAWLLDDIVTADPAGARVLIVQGLGDQVMPAASQAACDVAKLRAEGVDPDVCSDTFATHDTVLERKIEHAAAWAEALATGVTPPTCSSSFLPACAIQ